MGPGEGPAPEAAKGLEQRGADAMTTTSEEEIKAVHGVLTDPRPLDFQALGLAGCIDRLATPLRGQGTRLHWETPHHGVEIDARSASLLYRAAQETLSNTYKYAHATDVTIRLDAVYHGIRLVISDNGTGFDCKKAVRGRQHGFGLRLMCAAVTGAGGSSVVDSNPGTGTRVTITLPLD